MKEEKPSITAILDIFSGRPNPMWNLSDDEIEKLKTNLKDLPSAKPRKRFGMGYRGFIILNNAVADFPLKVEINDGVLAILDEERLVYKEDANRIEEWLLNRVRSLSREQKLGLEEILPK